MVSLLRHPFHILSRYSHSPATPPVYPCYPPWGFPYACHCTLCGKREYAIFAPPGKPISGKRNDLPWEDIKYLRIKFHANLLLYFTKLSWLVNKILPMRILKSNIFVNFLNYYFRQEVVRFLQPADGKSYYAYAVHCNYFIRVQ